MRRVIGLSCVLAICTVATIALADSKTYVPPPAEGDVYTVVRFKMGSFGTTQDTSVTAKWGDWSKSDKVATVKVPPTCGVSPNSGFVLKLRHRYPDKTPLTVTTDGTISKGPAQGNPPAEWGNQCYRRVSW